MGFSRIYELFIKRPISSTVIQAQLLTVSGQKQSKISHFWIFICVKVACISVLWMTSTLMTATYFIKLLYCERSVMGQKQFEIPN